MISAESFLTSSLRLAPQGESITRILAAAIEAVEPGEAVRRTVRREGEALYAAGRRLELEAFRQICLLGIGKASPAMAEALANILDTHLSAGLVVTKHMGGTPITNSKIEVLEGGHPVPDERSLLAGSKVVERLSMLGSEDLLFCLISGGGSALVTAPLYGITLEEVQGLTATLLKCGAPIEEINTLRRRLDRVKGGGAARLAGGATIISLILSDVVGSPLEVIASGPSAPDPETRSRALSILKKYELEDNVPASILHALRTGPETPKPGDPLFERVQNIVVGSNLTAAQAALSTAAGEGFHPYLLRLDMQGEAREAAFELAITLRQAGRTGDPVPRPACIVAGGETTVTLGGSGKGGRNTELALAAVCELAYFPGVMLVTLATDGEDGPTDAAGAVVTEATYPLALAKGLNPVAYLERHDSYSFFEALGDLLKPGPTRTNVNDLTLMFTF